MLVSSPRLPILNNVFRQMNERVSTISPLSVEASLRNVRISETPLKGSLDIDITEKKTGAGIPLAPFTVYVNNVEEIKGRCNTKGKHTHELSLKDHRSMVDVYHSRKRLVEASDSLSVLWDNFKGKAIDESVWTPMKSAGVYGGNSKLYQDERIFFDCFHAGWGAGVRLNEPVDIAGGSVSVKLKSGGYTVSEIGILPSYRPVFMFPGTGDGYVIGLWERGVNKFHIYRGSGGPVLSKPSFVGNPETIKFTLDDDNVVHIFEEGKEVFSEPYPYDTTLCNIYMNGMSWYWQGGGISWADDFLYVSG